MNLIIRRDPEVASETDPADLDIVVGPIVTAALLALAIVVALFVSGVHYFALFLLLLSGPLERIWLRRGA
jgi:TMEM175 potassium channel family protein